MVGALKQIEQDIAKLEEVIEGISQDLQQNYHGYLKALGQAVRQQFILACYHLCTQGYPVAFLQLSFSARQTLQQNLRQLAGEVQEKLLALSELKIADLSPSQFRNAANTKLSQEESISPIEEGGEIDDDSEEDISITEEMEQDTEGDFAAEDLESSLEEQELSRGSNVEDSEAAALPHLDSKSALLDRINYWQYYLEREIVKILKLLSRDSNFLLQKSGILPQKLPEKVLEAAAKVETMNEAIVGPPNLLNLVIETEESEESQNTTVTRLMAVHLRLPEIEFSDASLAAWRHQIRNLLAKLVSVRREYLKKQREKAVLEAESAWRSSWFEP